MYFVVQSTQRPQPFSQRHQRFVQQSVCAADGHSYADGHEYAYADPHDDADGHSYAYVHSNANGHSDQDADAYPYAHPHAAISRCPFVASAARRA